MRKLTLTIALIGALATPALAYTPSQGVTFRDFVEARGCVLNQVKGAGGTVLYSTFASGCPAAAEFTPVGTILVDHDNDPSTPNIPKSDN